MKKKYSMFELEEEMFKFIELEVYNKKNNTSICRTQGFSKIDGFIVKHNIVTSILELKSKTYLTTKNLKMAQEGWLIDWKKVETIAKLSKELALPTYLYGYIPNDKKIFVWLISDKEGKIQNCSDPIMKEISTNSETRVKKFKKITFLKFSNACKIIIAEKIDNSFLENNQIFL